MQKTLEILEKNVQWIVLGLATLFLVWVAYAYVINPPAKVTIGPQVATAGDVSTIVKRTATDMENQIKASGSVSFPTPDLVSNWRQHIEQPFAEALAANWTSSLPELENGPHGPNNTPLFAQIATLPVPPKAQPLPPAAGLSTVSLVAPNAANNNPNPNAIPAQPAAQQQKDTDWIMLSAVLPAARLSEALLAPLKGQQIDPALYNTTLLEVVVERQKSTGVNANGVPTFPAGNQGIETVPTLAIYQQDMQKPPPDSAPENTRFQFVDWAQQHQDLIGGPQFNTVLAGDPWAPPQMPANVPAGGVAPAAPVTPVTPPATTTPPPATTTPPPPAPTPKPTTTTPPPSTTTPPPTTPTPRPMTPQRPTVPPVPPVQRNNNGRNPNKTSYAPYDPARPAGAGFPGSRDMGGGFNRGDGASFIPGANFNNAGGGGGNNGQGVLNPFAITSDVLIWAIDETAKPGQTYRYRFIYKLKNPVFGVQNMAPPNLVDQLAIVSPPSDWTDAIRAPDITKFWFAKADPRNDRGTIDVFQYKDGSWKALKNWTANPGDQVPGTELTIVDVRTGDDRKPYGLLATDTGDMLRRDVATDAADPDHATMLNPNPTGAPTDVAPPPGPSRRGVSAVGRGE